MDGRYSIFLNSAPDGPQNRRGSAFIIESLLLLIFVAASVAIVVQLIGAGYSQGEQATRLSTSVSLAQNEAERFTADPHLNSRRLIYMKTGDDFKEIASRKLSDDSAIEYEGEELSASNPSIFIVERKMKTKKLDSGNLYNAKIKVFCQESEIYSLDTSKYIPSNAEDSEDEDTYGGDTQ